MRMAIGDAQCSTQRRASELRSARAQVPLWAGRGTGREPENLPTAQPTPKREPRSRTQQVSHRRAPADGRERDGGEAEAGGQQPGPRQRGRRGRSYCARAEQGTARSGAGVDCVEAVADLQWAHQWNARCAAVIDETTERVGAAQPEPQLAEATRGIGRPAPTHEADRDAAHRIARLAMAMHARL